MSVVLLGYRGSGKTSVGAKLADRMWLKFVDTDDLIVKAVGMTIREIFEKDGESRFRDLESDAIREALSGDEKVIALGGGAVLREPNRVILKNDAHRRIYLRCEPQVLHERIQADQTTAATRPALTHLGGGIDEIRSLLAQREPLYREVMTAELDVTNLSIDEAATYVARLL
jgi:shikimate kinase